MARVLRGEGADDAHDFVATLRKALDE
jgi:hypothetical protein